MKIEAEKHHADTLKSWGKKMFIFMAKIVKFVLEFPQHLLCILHNQSSNFILSITQ